MKIIRLLPLLLVLIVGSVIVMAMGARSVAVTSPLQGRVIPAFTLASLQHEKDTLTEASLAGKLNLLNVWASWCGICKSEHRFLMELAREEQVQIVGLNYRDNRQAALKELEVSGNPYSKVIFDPKGSLAIDLGVYGTPESYLVDQQGVIRHRYVGALTSEVWQQEFVPVIKQLTSVTL